MGFLDGIGGWLREPARYARLGISKDRSSVVGQLYLEPATARPTGILEGRIGWDDAANGLVACDGTQYRSISDRHLINVDIDANSVDKNVFIADRAYKVLAIKEAHSVVGGSAAVAQLRKCTGTTAPASGNALQTANFDLTATINTVLTATLTATAADLLLAAGDRIALDVGGTLTGLVGRITVVLEQV